MKAKLVSAILLLLFVIVFIAQNKIPKRKYQSSFDRIEKSSVTWIPSPFLPVSRRCSLG